jgi:hypothetical protein
MSKEEKARDLLARVATHHLKRLYEVYETGVGGYHPSHKALDAFNEASLALLSTVAQGSLLQKADKKLKEAYREAQRDDGFQQFITRVKQP